MDFTGPSGFDILPKEFHKQALSTFGFKGKQVRILYTANAVLEESVSRMSLGESLGRRKQMKTLKSEHQLRAAARYADNT